MRGSWAENNKPHRRLISNFTWAVRCYVNARESATPLLQPLQPLNEKMVDSFAVEMSLSTILC